MVFVTSVQLISPTCAQVASVEVTCPSLILKTFPMWIMLPAFSEPLFGHLSDLSLPRKIFRGLALHLVVFQYSGMRSFNCLLSYQKWAHFQFFFSHIGSVLITLDEMQIAEFWQLSGDRILVDWLV